MPRDLADQRVEVAVAVEVGEGRSRVGPDVGDPEGVRRKGGEGGRARAPRVLEEPGIALEPAGEEVEVAVAVDVREGGYREETGARDAEGVRRVAREVRHAPRARVLEEDDTQVVGAHQGVEVAVAVEIGEDRPRRDSEVGQAEGMGGIQEERAQRSRALRLRAAKGRGERAERVRSRDAPRRPAMGTADAAQAGQLGARLTEQRTSESRGRRSFHGAQPASTPEARQARRSPLRWSPRLSSPTSP